MKKTMRKLVPAICMLLISAVLLGTSTYAWFSMNRKVTVTGMTLHTKVGSNLLIAAPGDDGEGNETLDENDFQSALNQVVTGIVEPTSTIDGISYFYHTTDNIAVDGHSEDLVYRTYAEGDTFDENYGFTTASTVEAYGYKDYAFYLKAINAESTNQKLAMSTCNLIYEGNVISEKAWRVAVFAKSTLKNTAVEDATAVAEANRITILAPASATYFNAGQAVDSTSSRAAVKTSVQNGLGAAANIATLLPGTTTYYKVVVRIWLEGEDNTCNNETFAALTKDYRLDLAFEIKAADGVTAIGSVGVAEATKSTVTGTVTLSDTTTGTITNGETAASFQWVDASDDSDIASATNYTYTNTAATKKKVYCLVTTDRGNVYRTNTIELDEVVAP